jgi:uncharacterized protein (DUF2384 family)
MVSGINTLRARFKKLGLNNPYNLVFIARKGVKAAVFYEFADAAKFSEKSLAGIINLSARTLSNYKEQDKALEPVYSEHLLKLINLFEKGEIAFGTVEEFNYWLKKPFWKSKEAPIDWIITSGGVDLVSKELDKLMMGYPV